MNSLAEKGKLKELACGENFAYVLENRDTFLSTEYKVFQSQEDGCFLRCMKLLYNGKMEFYYLSSGYRSLEDLLPTLDEGKFLTIVSGLLSNVVRIKSNGFLSCRNVDLSCDRIFVDVNTCKVRLVYLPVSEGFFPDEAAFESELRTGLIRIISAKETLSSSPAMQQLAADLSNGLLSMEALTGHILSGSAATGTAQDRGGLRLVAVNAPEKVVLHVNKASYVIGKNPSRADGVVSFNKMISRVHCRIFKQDARYVIEDLGSSNGTFVNGARLRQGQTAPLGDGDVVRLANSDFRAEIR